MCIRDRTQRVGQLGSFIGVGAPLLTLVETQNIELDAQIPSHLAAELARASSTVFSTHSGQWPVELSRLSPVVEAGLRTQSARLTFIGDPASIGLSGDLRWSISGGLLPADLVVRRDAVAGIFVADNGTARFTPLPNVQEGRPVVVSLPGSTMIIVDGREKLQDGDSITISQ